MDPASRNQCSYSLVSQNQSVNVGSHKKENGEDEKETEDVLSTPESSYFDLKKKAEEAAAKFILENPKIPSEDLTTFNRSHSHYCEKLDTLYEQSKRESGSPEERAINLERKAANIFHTHVMQMAKGFTGQNSSSTSRKSLAKFNAGEKRIMRRKEESYQEIQVEIDERIKRTAIKLEIAETKGCSPASVSDEDVEEYLKTKSLSRQNEADQLMQELIEEEESKKVSASRKKTKNKKKKRARGKGESSIVSQKTKKDAVTTTKSLEEARGEYLASIYHRKKMAELPRVTNRWQTDKPEEIRKFEDKNAVGEIVCRYEKLNDQKIAEQRLRHYLPGTERIFADSEDRKVYSFPTDRGVGMFAMLTLADGPRFGILYFGIREDEVIFHRYFEEFKVGQIRDKNIFDDQTEDSVVHNETLLKEEEGEKWECNVPYNIDVSSKGVLTITYPKEAHSIAIFPIRKDLLDPKLFTAS